MKKNIFSERVYVYRHLSVILTYEGFPAPQYFARLKISRSSSFKIVSYQE